MQRNRAFKGFKQVISYESDFGNHQTVDLQLATFKCNPQTGKLNISGK